MWSPRGRAGVACSATDAPATLCRRRPFRAGQPEGGRAGVSLPLSLWLWPRHVLFSVLEGDMHLACPSGTVPYCDAP